MKAQILYKLKTTDTANHGKQTTIFVIASIESHQIHTANYDDGAN